MATAPAVPVAAAPALVRTRLSLMMFLEYFVWSAWGISVATYAAKTLSLDSGTFAWIVSTTALGAMISPFFVGLVADRFFSTERVLAVLHAIGGVALCLAAGVEHGGIAMQWGRAVAGGLHWISGGYLGLADPQTLGYFPPLMTLMMINALCYMPTLALTNSLAFRNIRSPENDFPIIRVWGTIGWIVAGVIVGSMLGETANTFFYLAGLAGLAMAVYCLTLPHTPPVTSEEAARDVLGLRALKMLKQRSFAVFVISAFLVCFVLSLYWTGANVFLTETDAPAPTALQTLGQVSEIFFMIAMPIFILRFGMKWTLMIGILAWVARYLCFASLIFPLVLLGLILHGVCYDFFFVAAYIYVDKRAPRDLRASAQSFITFVMLGLGMFVGTQAAGQVMALYPAVTIKAVDDKGEVNEKAALPEWPAAEAYSGAWRYLDLKQVIRPWLFPSEKAAEQKKAESLATQLGSANENEIDVSQFKQSRESRLTIDGKTYSKDDLVQALNKADADGNGVVTRPEWRKAQAYQWRKIWLWPLGVALATAVFFWIGFREDDTEEGSEPGEPDESEKPGA